MSKSQFKGSKMTIPHFLQNLKRNEGGNADFKLDTRIKISLRINKNKLFIFMYGKR